ncbi:MAG TPA: hypothetical protein VJ866_02700 [Pyrinomonadaceae bacterium]|nr:hypothetical protein [Pyrinomonadaceae bacterium]
MNTRRQRATFTAGLAVALAAILALAGSHAIHAQDAYPSTDDLPTCPHVCPTKTINLDNSARQPFVLSFGNTFDDGQLETGFEPFDAVPDGKRLVIEYVNGRVDAEGVIIPLLITTVDGKEREWNLHLQPMGVNPSDPSLTLYAIDSPVKIYSDPGGRVKLDFWRPHGVKGNISVKVSLSGYFVNL